MVLCKCGCGKIVTKRRRLYIDGHLIPWNKNKTEVYSGQTLKKMSMAAKERFTNPENHPMYGKHQSEKSKEKNRKSHLGKPSKLKGVKQSYEHKRKNSEAHRKEKHNLWGTHRSEETKKKIGDGNRNKIVSEETKNKMRGENHPMYGKHLSDERKKLSSFPGKLNPMYGKPPFRNIKRYNHDSQLQGKVCFRSSYELKFAKYLNEHNIPWLYEIQTFDLGDTTYTPDFFLPISNLFIEVKGYMTNKAKDKINKFLDNYNNETLLILRKQDLINLGIKL